MDETRDKQAARKAFNRQIRDVAAELAAEAAQPQPAARPAHLHEPTPNMAKVSAAGVERLTAAARTEAERAYLDAAWDRIHGR